MFNTIQFLFLMQSGKMVIQDQKILNTFKKDDEEGLKVLFDRYYRPLCVFAMKFLDDIQVAEDIVQEVFIRFWEDKKYKDVGRSLKNYLFVSVRNRSLNYLESYQHAKKEYLNHLKEEFGYEQFTNEEISEKKQKLQEEIGKLPPQSKKVLMKIIFEKKKYKEVSEELNISLNTVKTHFSRALRQLRGSIDILVIVLLP